uniref:Uncharacterized protein n=1 Tax=Morchella brunnea TaxID=1174671 RepID=A0A8K1MH65_9PEZI|nr:hypothetical protein LK370_mgp251 [Morchella brunnea]UBU98341.1 hypothetical protein [Morchella brunnea]
MWHAALIVCATYYPPPTRCGEGGVKGFCACTLFCEGGRMQGRNKKNKFGFAKKTKTQNACLRSVHCMQAECRGWAAPLAAPKGAASPPTPWGGRHPAWSPEYKCRLFQHAVPGYRYRN